jgi:tetratricopeptide (TPR) repeat protein
MADQTKAAEAAKRIIDGEKPATVFGVTDQQLKAIVALGYNQYQQGRFKDAETASYMGFAGLGAVALAKKPPELDAAFTNLTKAAELKPDDATIQANLGEVLLRQGKIDDAKQHLEKAFALDPGHSDPGVNRVRAIVSGLDMIVKEVEKRVEARSTLKAS